MIYIYTIRLSDGQIMESVQPDRQQARNEFVGFIKDCLAGTALDDFLETLSELDREFDYEHFAMKNWYGASIIVTCQTHQVPGTLQ